MICPKCKSKSINKHGHSRGKQRYLCKKCQKTFTEFSYKKYPPTSVHPLFIALILHRYKDESLDKMTRRVNNWLEIFKSHNVSVGTKDKVSRSTVYKWINNYDEFVSNVSSKQSNRFFQDLLLKAFPEPIDKEPPEEKIVGKEMELTAGFESYPKFLEFLQKAMYKNYLNELLKDKKFLLDLYKKYKQRTIKHRYLKLKYE